MTDTLGITTAAAMPLPARLRLLADGELGVGNFLDKARALSPDPAAPFLFAQRVTDRGSAVEPLSLDRITEIRDAYAAWYHANGVRKGNPVAVYLGEGVDPFLHFLALSSLGAIAALVNGRMDPAIAAAYTGRIGAVGVVADRARLDALVASGELPDTTKFLVAAEDLPTEAPDRGALPSLFPYPPGDDDPVMLCHTSGTTGPPKSAVFAHRQFFLGKRHRLWSFPAARRNRALSALPQSHSAGISYLMTATLLGLPIVVMADTSGAAVREMMLRVEPTLVIAFPQTWAELAQLDLTGAADRVHTWINTGDSAHEAHIKALVRHGFRPGKRGRRGRAGSEFVDGLGSSEMGMALFRKVSDPTSTDYGRCVGVPVKVVTEATVLDDNGRKLGPGKVGRLGVRTPTRTPGYWNASELTAQSSLSGFWLTGDVVYRDEQGRFFHVDRVPDVIHTQAGPVYSLPLEEAILVGCPRVADCAVVAVDAPEGGSAPFATVKLGPGHDPSDDILATLNDALVRRGLTRLRGAVVATDDADFPTGATGKVLKRRLRERFASVLTGPATTGTGSTDAVPTRTVSTGAASTGAVPTETAPTGPVPTGSAPTGAGAPGTAGRVGVPERP
ncbi:class I adenylate-forming enzyme family protein [Actinokineospora terrae]|uniref:Acyl-CoA synthetase (AMP-forming)/AMP-acid ligase II n=1 Tax=Actinokineospora terrae TaxID=155974 RepID=A0A1H9LGX4_9PSEU|nr:class I adenylate-forming enzyme family protein [Actinokineospora terrae]SER10467.1 Acyl-CoA synthetase (AMP-forming)/AMP-acid ligase II [Actinokineospora terrae]